MRALASLPRHAPRTAASLLGIALLCGATSAGAHGDTGHAHAHDEATAQPRPTASSGTRALQAGPVTITMLAEAANLGRGDIEVGELLLPPAASPTPPHQHGSLEMFYVVEGVLGHEVNGVAQRLEPGQLGIVHPGDTVVHRVLSSTPVKAVVIWVPGGEADALVEHAGFTATPLPAP